MSAFDIGLPKPTRPQLPDTPGQQNSVLSSGPDSGLNRALGQGFLEVGKGLIEGDPVAFVRGHGMIMKANAEKQAASARAAGPSLMEKAQVGPYAPETPPMRRVDSATGSPLSNRAQDFMNNLRSRSR